MHRRRRRLLWAIINLRDGSVFRRFRKEKLGLAWFETEGARYAFNGYRLELKSKIRSFEKKPLAKRCAP